MSKLHNPTMSSSSSVSSSPKTDPVVLATATLNWTIDRFKSLKEFVVSQSFFAPNDQEQKFRLFLSPKIKMFLSNEVYIILWHTLIEKELPLRYRVSILNETNQKVYSVEFRWNYFETNYHWKHLNFTPYLEYDKAVGYLVNGSLKVHCEVDVLETKLSTNQKVIVTAAKAEAIVAYNKILQSDYQALLKSGDLSDIVCVAGGKEFKVHKNILAARSSVFKAMFSADLEDKKNNRLKITDVDADVFEQLLAYIYSGKIPNLKEFGLDLFVVADKYHLDHLKSMCEQSLHSCLTTSSVCTVLLLADMHNAAQLKSKCIECITSNAEAVMATEAWNILLKSSKAELIAELFKRSVSQEKTLTKKSGKPGS